MSNGDNNQNPPPPNPNDPGPGAPSPTGPGPIIDQRGAIIESKMNMERAQAIGVSLGGLNTQDMAQVIEYAKGMSLSESMVPAFCRNKIWTCFGICVQAIEWRLSPFALARMAYEVENRRTHEKTVAYMSQVHHAVLESRKVLKERLRVRYQGEGDETVCIVVGTFREESEPREWTSPKLGDRRPRAQKRFDQRSGQEYETTPGSPLWQDKPLVQLFYDTSRDWVRIYCPDVTMGIYTEDEMGAAGFTPLEGGPALETESLTTRLSQSALARAGFPVAQGAAAVDAELARRDNSSGVAESLSVSQAGDGSPERDVTSPAPAAAGEAQGPSDDDAATPAPETSQSRPRGPRARRTGRPPDDARLV